MTEPEQDPSDFTTFGDDSNDDRPAGRGARSSTPKWIAALVVTALVAGGVAWFVTDRSKAEDLGEPVAKESVTSSTTVDPDATGEAVDPPEEEVSWLFSLTATGGTFGANSLNPNIGTITLTGVSAETVGFTDRPVRDAVTFATDKLPAAWPEIFADSDPNAVLVTTDGDGTRHSYVLELSSPTSDGDSLTFQVAAIEGKDHSSHLPGMNHVAATVPPVAFGEVTLFIDSVTPPGPRWVCAKDPEDVYDTQVNPPAPIPFDSWDSPASKQFEAQCFAKHATPMVIGSTS